jgi:phosphoribosylamine--glycine ligase
MYLGLMKTAAGCQVLELNCRDGDPETQVQLPSLKGSFLELCEATAQGRLEEVGVPEQVRESLCVVLASQEYPEGSKRDEPFTGWLEAQKFALLFPAGMRTRGGLLTTGEQGRLMGVTAVRDTLYSARTFAYFGAKEIGPPEALRYRKDIGEQYLKEHP